jgi:hypothetical protein
VVLKGRHHNGWLTITEAAELADMSVRSLQRKLASSGVVYRELADQARAELAVEMLKDKALRQNLWVDFALLVRRSMEPLGNLNNKA